MFNHSPRAYRYLRQKFSNHIPNPQTIRQWYKNSNLDSTSGIGQNSLEALKRKAEEMMEKNGEQLVVSLTFDEIAIQRNMLWSRSQNKFIGLIDRGTPKVKEEFDLATNVIVFMVCGVNAKFEQPVAYYFIQTLNANERAELVLEMLTEISKLGIKVKNITFDGYSSNISMCKLLGANVKDKDGEYVTHFENPFDKSRVYIIIDPSHVIKLIRNLFGGRLVLWNKSGKKIEWKHYVNLVNYSNTHRINLAHKLNKRHMLWKDRKMNVRLAVETMSGSCANSLEFLMKRGEQEFENVAETVEFTRIIDKIFDIMNTQAIESDNENIFKSAMNPANYEEIYNFLMYAKKYLVSLKVVNLSTGKRQRVINSDISTGMRGVVINITSLLEMYRELIEEQKWMPSLPTYRLSQDHLEMLFGKIRTLNGYNDNPNAQQFSSAYRKLLYDAEIMLSKYSNVEVRSTSNVLTVSSCSKKDEKFALAEIEEHFHDDPEARLFEEEHDILNEFLFENARDPGIAHIANELERRLKHCGQIYCDLCLKVLIENEKVDDEICVSLEKGKLCKSTFNVCKITDIAIKGLINKSTDFKNAVYKTVLQTIDWNDTFADFHDGEDEEHGEDHKQFLVKYFIDEYINITCAQIAKQTTIESKKKYLRNRYKKLVHNKHQ